MLARHLWILTNPKKEMIWVNHEKKVRALQKQLKRLSNDSDLYYFKDKGSIKITSKLEALGGTLLSGAIGWILTKFAYFTSISGPHVTLKENSFKKNLQKQISPL